jgi:hypothetical protein
VQPWRDIELGCPLYLVDSFDIVQLDIGFEIVYAPSDQGPARIVRRRYTGQRDDVGGDLHWSATAWNLDNAPLLTCEGDGL